MPSSLHRTSGLDNGWMNLHFDLCAVECLGGRYVQKLCTMLKRVTVFVIIRRLYDNRFAPLLYLLCVAEIRKCLLRWVEWLFRESSIGYICAVVMPFNQPFYYRIQTNNFSLSHITLMNLKCFLSGLYCLSLHPDTQSWFVIRFVITLTLFYVSHSRGLVSGIIKSFTVTRLAVMLCYAPGSVPFSLVQLTNLKLLFG